MNNEEFKEYVKKDLLKEFKWLDYDINICYKGNIVVDLDDLDVNFKEWHGRKMGGHDEFYFHGKDYVCLTKDNYEKFKQVLKDYEEKYIKGE